MWNIDSIRRDPLIPSSSSSEVVNSFILSASVPIDAVVGSSFRQEEHRGWRVGLADFCSRHFRGSKQKREDKNNNNGVNTNGVNTNGVTNNPQQRRQEQLSVRIEALDEALYSAKRRKSSGRKRSYHPYVVERSDFYCCNDDNSLHITVRVVLTTTTSATNEGLFSDETETEQQQQQQHTPNGQQQQQLVVRDSSEAILRRIFVFGDPSFRKSLLEHIASVVLQQKLRSNLGSNSSSSSTSALDNAIAFVADGSILPRKSGTSDAPMASPPALPFKAPSGSRMTIQSIEIYMGSLAEHVPRSSKSTSLELGIIKRNKDTIVLSGLVVPKGITLICGGGYHGKSTLLQAISVGQYDKIPGDGRELCVSLPDAVTVRAEDGRYVNNCNISAFISDLPIPPGVTTPLDTEHFSTRDSSGSTSQAANVSEAIELGARALLVDEDISAANFMARDGRMRALVMDESITPLLYRVNGLYNTHGISTVVVVGGVGDWLDVPHNVILLDKYVVFDATAKAQSISRQFSYGHVQYAGRGVVHRLEWEEKGTPKLRRPKDSFSKRFDSDVVVSLMDGGRGLVVCKEDNKNEEPPMADNGRNRVKVTIDDDVDDDEEEEGYVDASRLGQLLGKKQLFATGLCVAWILQHAPINAEAGLKDLLKRLDSVLDRGGMNLVVNQLKETDIVYSSFSFSKSMIQVFESVGYVERPRNFEIGQALTRMRGIRFEEVAMQDDDGSEEAARIEAENRKKALVALWEKRRSKNQTFK